jgi:hypothetical protein
MREETNVGFKISSATIPAKDLAAHLGLKPDRSWLLGQARGVFGVVEKMHGFELESKLGPQSSLEEHIKSMLERLAPCAQKIGALGTQVVAEFSCSIKRRKAPILHFDHATIRWLGVMNARLDIDTQIVVDAPPPKAGGAAGAAGAAGGEAPKT